MGLEEPLRRGRGRPTGLVPTELGGQGTDGDTWRGVGKGRRVGVPDTWELHWRETQCGHI